MSRLTTFCALAAMGFVATLGAQKADAAEIEVRLPEVAKSVNIKAGGPDPGTCSEIGDECSDGTYFAGVPNNTGKTVFLAPADFGSKKKFSSDDVDDSDELNSPWGQKLTKSLLEASATYEAAQACSNANIAGYSDWFLPYADRFKTVSQKMMSKHGDDGGLDRSANYWAVSQSQTTTDARYIYDLDEALPEETRDAGLKAKIRCARTPVVDKKPTKDISLFNQYGDPNKSAVKISEESNVGGLDTPVDVSIRSGKNIRVSVAGGGYTSSPGKVGSNESIAVQSTDTGPIGTITGGVITVGTGYNQEVMDTYMLATGPDPDFSSCDAAGETCDDGSIMIEDSVGDDYVTSVKVATDKQWNKGQDIDLGETETSSNNSHVALIGINGDNSGDDHGPNPAAVACQQSTAHGRNDWTLPTETNYQDIQDHASGVLGSSTYWTVNSLAASDPATEALAWDAASGAVLYAEDKQNQYDVVCVR